MENAVSCSAVMGSRQMGRVQPSLLGPADGHLMFSNYGQPIPAFCLAAYHRNDCRGCGDRMHSALYRRKRMEHRASSAAWRRHRQEAELGSCPGGSGCSQHFAGIVFSKQNAELSARPRARYRSRCRRCGSYSRAVVSSRFHPNGPTKNGAFCGSFNPAFLSNGRMGTTWLPGKPRKNGGSQAADHVSIPG